MGEKKGPTAMPVLNAGSVGAVDDTLRRLEAELQSLRGQLSELRFENEGLAGEVLNSYEQLNLIFGFSQSIISITAPNDIERMLARQTADALAPADVYVLQSTGTRVWADEHTNPAFDSVANLERAAQMSIEETRRERQARVVKVGEMEMLLCPASRLDDKTDLIIACRDASNSFKTGEIAVVEALVGFASQIISNSDLHERLARMSIDTTRALVAAIDKKDQYTSGHSERVGLLTRLTAAELGVPAADLRVYEWAGLLHDVGKIGVPEQILTKPGKLTDEEFAIIKKHPEMGYEILQPIASLKNILDGVLYHHENPDGTGYPSGLAGHDIPLVARVIHVVDVFDALSSNRSYRRAFSLEESLTMLRRDAGAKLDAAIVTAFITALERFEHEQPNEYQSMFERLRRGPWL